MSTCFVYLLKSFFSTHALMSLDSVWLNVLEETGQAFCCGLFLLFYPIILTEVSRLT